MNILIGMILREAVELGEVYGNPIIAVGVKTNDDGRLLMVGRRAMAYPKNYSASLLREQLELYQILLPELILEVLYSKLDELIVVVAINKLGKNILTKTKNRA